MCVASVRGAIRDIRGKTTGVRVLTFLITPGDTSQGGLNEVLPQRDPVDTLCWQPECRN